MKSHSVELGLDAGTRAFYRLAIKALTDAQVPFLVGGAYALGAYTGIIRHTKDLDLFLKPSDYPRALEVMKAEGLRTEVTDPIWLAKAFSPDGAFIDFIFRSGNGVSEVDDEWFSHARETQLLDLPVKVCPPEETLWSKAFIMERERFDGPDVAHYLLACGAEMDWARLVRRFGSNWRVLFSHLILFGYIYPDKANIIPENVMSYFVERLRNDSVSPSDDKLCRGTLLSRTFYLVDVGPWGRTDARFEQRGSLTEDEVRAWKEHADAEAPNILERAGIHVAV